MATLFSTHCPSHPYLQPSFSSNLGRLQHLHFSSPSKLYHQNAFHLHGAIANAVATTVNAAENGSADHKPVKPLNAELLSSVTSSEEYQQGEASFNKNDENVSSTVSITVVGASGDLAKKKIYPALFELYYEDCLPKHFEIYCHARSKMTDAELRDMINKSLTSRI